MKRHILLTGRPGIGKSTVIAKVIERLSDVSITGFYTQEVRGPKGRLGFEAVRLDGHSSLLAHIGESGPHRVGKYGVAVDRFERDIVASIDPGQRTEGGIIVIDEIGKMEIISDVFRETVVRALDSTATVLGTIGLQDDPFTRAIRSRPDVRIVEVRKGNRDALVGQLVKQLMEALN